jgi:hypothetical protein
MMMMMMIMMMMMMYGLRCMAVPRHRRGDAVHKHHLINKLQMPRLTLYSLCNPCQS